MAYNQIDKFGDVGLSVRSDSLQGLFIESARGLYSLMTGDSGTVKGDASETMELSSRDIEGLYIKWLNELIYLFDARGFVARTINITAIDTSNFTLRASLSGGAFDFDNNVGYLLIKAATYHDLRIIQTTGGGYEAEVMFDI